MDPTDYLFDVGFSKDGIHVEAWKSTIPVVWATLSLESLHFLREAIDEALKNYPDPNEGQPAAQ